MKTFIVPRNYKYFYGMTNSQINTFIINLNYKWQHCVNGKSLYCNNQKGDRVLMIRAGVIDFYIDSGANFIYDLDKAVVGRKVVDMEIEFREELQFAQFFFILFGTRYLHPRRGCKTKNVEYNKTAWDGRPASKLRNHELHQALLYIEKGDHTKPDVWRKFDVMITPDTVIKNSRRYYNNLRRDLINRFELEAPQGGSIGKTIRINYGEGQEVILRMKGQRQTVGSSQTPENYERQKELAKELAKKHAEKKRRKEEDCVSEEDADYDKQVKAKAPKEVKKRLRVNKEV
ncbi:unnamed protein product [Orchesella dallaii]|uniref:Uncharacterized protein n=1 Tax=Orchesella dallaii TaxID=48710 RepID=A0ABP1PVI4_9HEXA